MLRRRRAPSEVTPPTIRDLTIDESQWRGQQLELARSLVERYAGSSELPPTPASLDVAVDGWLDDRSDDRVAIDDLVSAIGVALGHHLVARLRRSWAVAVDEASTELVVRGGAHDVPVYPCRLVAERIVAGERRFVEPALAELSAQLGEP